MTHNLVYQIQFARLEFKRVMSAVPPEDAVRRLIPSNSLSWIVGHLANQEQFMWVAGPHPENQLLYPDLNEIVGYGRPATTPAWDEMWAVWEQITAAADQFLEPITAHDLEQFFIWNGKPVRENIGTMLLRNIYHYWFHIGEAHGLRQQMGHVDLPQFVARDMSPAAWIAQPDAP